MNLIDDKQVLVRTVEALIANCEIRRHELKNQLSEERIKALALLRNADSVDQARDILRNCKDAAIQTRIKQFEETLEYLGCCDIDARVSLSIEQWRNFEKGHPSLEWC